MTEHHGSHDDPAMLTVAQKAVAVAWYESAGKVVALIGGIVTIVAAVFLFVGWLGGGIRVGSQVDTAQLATTTKLAIDALTEKIGNTNTSVKELQRSIAEANKKLDQVPLSAQEITDQDDRLRRLELQMGAYNDRLTADELKAAALVPGWTGLYRPPEVRQPNH